MYNCTPPDLHDLREGIAAREGDSHGAGAQALVKMISLGQDRSTGVQPDVCLLCSVFLVLCSVLCIVISFGHDRSSGEVALKISTGAMCVSSPIVPFCYPTPCPKQKQQQCMCDTQCTVFYCLFSSVHYI